MPPNGECAWHHTDRLAVCQLAPGVRACCLHPSSSAGKPASLLLSTAAAVSLPNHAWYTKPRAPRPTSSHTGTLQAMQQQAGNEAT